MRSHPLRIAVLIEAARASDRGLCRGVAQYAREHGPWSIFFSGQSVHRKLPAWLKDWKGDGILARLEDKAAAEQLLSLNLPVVDLVGKFQFPGVPRFATDHEAVARLAAEFFRASGFRHFAFCGYPGLFFSDKRSQAFEAFLKERAIPCFVYSPPGQTSSIRDTTNSEMRGLRYEAAIADWLKTLPRPIAVLACNDTRGQQVLAACLDHGIACPEDVAVMGVDNDDVVCELATPPMTSIVLDLQRQGYAGAARLEQLIRGRNGKKQALARFIAPKGIIERQSTDVIAVDDPVVVRVLRLIRSEAGKGIDVKAVLRQVGLSRSSLEQRFVQQVGRSVKGEIQRTRLQLVENFLRDTHLPLEDITARTGFRTASHLINLFRRLKGVTPGQFRAAHRVSANVTMATRAGRLRRPSKRMGKPRIT
jgi:LacI family transcriptional regulator